MSKAERSNIQNHLTIDFPIKGPANAKALTQELPPLMPDFAKAQDHLGTVHFSRFMVKGDEKLLFLSNLDGEIETHLARLVENASPVLDAIFKHVEDPPATPVASNPQRVIRWLKHHVREPIDTYFAYEASVQDIKACRACGGLYRQDAAESLADSHVHQVTSASLCLEIGEGPDGKEGPRRDGHCWDGTFLQLGAL